MKEKINIAEILKDKPKRTKLYTDTFGEVSIEDIDAEEELGITLSSKDNDELLFYNDGRYNLYGEPILVPSKSMHDWRKFAWKKGDVLVSNDGKCKVIFERFDDDTYTSFVGKYYVECYGKNDELQDYEEEHYGDTVNYTKESEEAAQTYINTIEERLGGKLNMETLEIDKTQPEFKDGDVVCISGMGYLAYGIVKSINNSSKKLEYYVLNDMSTLKFEDWLSFEDKQIQPITETLQIILFDALAKKGKAWDAEKKQVVDLKPKWTPKPFDRVITRNAADDVWTANFFSHMDSHGEYVTIGCVGGYTQCLPYNEETAKLIGTTKDVEG